MKPSLICLAVAAALATPAWAQAPRLTIYSGGYEAVVQSGGQASGAGHARYQARLSWDLVAGDNAIRLGGLPPLLDVGSVRLEPAGAARVRGQRYDFGQAGQQALLQRAIGQTVVVEQAVGNQREKITGTLLAAGDGLVLRLPGGQVKVLSGWSAFELPSLPEGVATEPGIAWTLSAPRAGREAFDLEYGTAGLAWRAEYQATVAGQGGACRMRLDGAALVANGSGADFRGVALTLVAGEPNRVSDGYAPAPMMAKAERAMMVADAAPVPEASGEYHAYRLPGTGDLPQGSVQRLPLLDPVDALPCERRYQVDASMGQWQPPHPIIDANWSPATDKPPVTATLAFENRKARGLGLPLPAGRVRVFDGGELLGEASLAHTPADARVELALGTVFDLTAERRRDDFQLDRSGRTMTETITVILRNAKPEAATVHLREALPRWSEWEITASSVPARKLDAQLAGFEVKVPAGGEAQLSYTVRYRWAPDVRIP